MLKKAAITLAIGAVLATVAWAIKSREFEITEEVLRAASGRVLGLVEKELGVSLKGSISFRLVDRKNLLAVRIKHRDWLNSVWKKGTALSAPSDKELEAGNKNILGYYNPHKKEVLVCPANFASSSKSRTAAMKTEEFFLAVLVHECVHAADDHEYEFASGSSSLTSADAIFYLDAVREGHAQFVARKICEANGWGEGFDTFTDCVTSPPRNMPANLAALLRLQTADRIATYADGERFIAAVFDAAGEDGVARAFAEPPADSSCIFFPERFFSPDRRPYNLYEVDDAIESTVSPFNGVEGVEPLRLFNIKKRELSLALMRDSLSLLPRRDVDRILKSVVAHHDYLFSTRLCPIATIHVTEFSTPRDAEFFLSAKKRASELQDEQQKKPAPTSSGWAYPWYGDVRGSEKNDWHGFRVKKEPGEPETGGVSIVYGITDSIGLELVVLSSSIEAEFSLTLANLLFLNLKKFKVIQLDNTVPNATRQSSPSFVGSTPSTKPPRKSMASPSKKSACIK